MKATLTNGIVVEGTPEELERFLQLQAPIPKPPTPALTSPAPGVPAHVTPAKPTTLPQTKPPAPAKALGGAAGTETMTKDQQEKSIAIMDAHLAKLAIRVFPDGDAWCAVGPNFINIVESPAAFAHTAQEAVAAYQAL